MREDNGLITGENSVFVVRGEDQVPLSPAWDGNTLVTVFDDEESAIGDLWVNTGDQWGPYHVTTRLLDGCPSDPGEAWEDVVELSISPTSELVVTEMIDNEPTIALVDAPGDYRLRVSARGRVARRDYDEDDLEIGDEEPIEWYLLEVWPAAPADPEVLRLTSSYAEFELNPPPALVIPEGEAGLAAAQRIGHDVDAKPGARTLSGDLGSVGVERTIRGTRRRLFLRCAHLTTWSHQWVEDSSWSWISGPGDTYEVGSPTWAFSNEHPDQLTGENGAVRSTFVEVEKPHRAVREWVWLASPPGRGASVDQWPPFLAKPTRITVTLTESRDQADEPWTTIRIDHEQLPVEWLDDMTTYWDYQLSIAEHAQFGVKK